MTDFTRAEAARRAGLDAAYLDRLIELGLLTPDGQDRLRKSDVRKAKLIQTLEGAGIRPEGLAAAASSQAL